MSYKIEGTIQVNIKENRIFEVKIKPSAKYLSPDDKYAVCYKYIENDKLKAKVIKLEDRYLKIDIDNELKSNTLLQNIALQRLTALFLIDD